MKILITGASGYVGSSLMEGLSPAFEVAGTSRSKEQPRLTEMDIAQERETLAVITGYNPDVIVHCAGAIGKADADLKQGTAINVEGTRNVVQAAQQLGAGVIFLSSAAVFNGRDGYFSETSRVESAGNYGKTKMEAEKIVSSSGLDHLVIRPSLVVGQAPHNTELTLTGRTITALEHEESVILDEHWRFSPTWNRDITTTIKWWLGNRSAANILHIGTTETTTQLEFARRIATVAGLDPALFRPRGGKPFRHNILDSSTARSLGVPLHSLDEIAIDLAGAFRSAKND